MEGSIEEENNNNNNNSSSTSGSSSDVTENNSLSLNRFIGNVEKHVKESCVSSPSSLPLPYNGKEVSVGGIRDSTIKCPAVATETPSLPLSFSSLTSSPKGIEAAVQLLLGVTAQLEMSARLSSLSPPSVAAMVNNLSAGAVGGTAKEPPLHASAHYQQKQPQSSIQQSVWSTISRTGLLSRALLRLFLYAKDARTAAAIIRFVSAVISTYDLRLPCPALEGTAPVGVMHKNMKGSTPQGTHNADHLHETRKDGRREATSRSSNQVTQVLRSCKADSAWLVGTVLMVWMRFGCPHPTPAATPLSCSPLGQQHRGTVEPPLFESLPALSATLWSAEMLMYVESMARSGCMDMVCRLLFSSVNAAAPAQLRVDAHDKQQQQRHHHLQQRPHQNDSAQSSEFSKMWWGRAQGEEPEDSSDIFINESGRSHTNLVNLLLLSGVSSSTATITAARDGSREGKPCTRALPSAGGQAHFTDRMRVPTVAAAAATAVPFDSSRAATREADLIAGTPYAQLPPVPVADVTRFGAGMERENFFSPAARAHVIDMRHRDGARFGGGGGAFVDGTAAVAAADAGVCSNSSSSSAPRAGVSERYYSLLADVSLVERRELWVMEGILTCALTLVDENCVPSLAERQTYAVYMVFGGVRHEATVEDPSETRSDNEMSEYNKEVVVPHKGNKEGEKSKSTLLHDDCASTPSEAPPLALTTLLTSLWKVMQNYAAYVPPSPLGGQCGWGDLGSYVGGGSGGMNNKSRSQLRHAHQHQSFHRPCKGDPHRHPSAFAEGEHWREAEEVICSGCDLLFSLLDTLSAAASSPSPAAGSYVNMTRLEGDGGLSQLRESLFTAQDGTPCCYAGTRKSRAALDRLATLLVEANIVPALVTILSSCAIQPPPRLQLAATRLLTRLLTQSTFNATLPPHLDMQEEPPMEPLLSQKTRKPDAACGPHEDPVNEAQQQQMARRQEEFCRVWKTTGLFRALRDVLARGRTSFRTLAELQAHRTEVHTQPGAREQGHACARGGGGGEQYGGGGGGGADRSDSGNGAIGSDGDRGNGHSAHPSGPDIAELSSFASSEFLLGVRNASTAATSSLVDISFAGCQSNNSINSSSWGSGPAHGSDVTASSGVDNGSMPAASYAEETLRMLPRYVQLPNAWSNPHHMNGGAGCSDSNAPACARQADRTEEAGTTAVERIEVRRRCQRMGCTATLRAMRHVVQCLVEVVRMCACASTYPTATTTTTTTPAKTRVSNHSLSTGSFLWTPLYMEAEGDERERAVGSRRWRCTRSDEGSHDEVKRSVRKQGRIPFCSYLFNRCLHAGILVDLRSFLKYCLATPGGVLHGLHSPPHASSGSQEAKEEESFGQNHYINDAIRRAAGSWKSYNFGRHSWSRHAAAAADLPRSPQQQSLPSSGLAQQRLRSSLYEMLRHSHTGSHNSNFCTETSSSSSQARLFSSSFQVSPSPSMSAAQVLEVRGDLEFSTVLFFSLLVQYFPVTTRHELTASTTTRLDTRALILSYLATRGAAAYLAECLSRVQVRGIQHILSALCTVCAGEAMDYYTYYCGARRGTSQQNPLGFEHMGPPEGAPRRRPFIFSATAASTPVSHSCKNVNSVRYSASGSSGDGGGNQGGPTPLSRSSGTAGADTRKRRFQAQSSLPSCAQLLVEDDFMLTLSRMISRPLLLAERVPLIALRLVGLILTSPCLSTSARLRQLARARFLLPALSTCVAGEDWIVLLRLPLLNMTTTPAYASNDRFNISSSSTGVASTAAPTMAKRSRSTVETYDTSGDGARERVSKQATYNDAHGGVSERYSKDDSSARARDRMLRSVRNACLSTQRLLQISGLRVLRAWLLAPYQPTLTRSCCTTPSSSYPAAAAASAPASSASPCTAVPPPPPPTSAASPCATDGVSAAPIQAPTMPAMATASGRCSPSVAAGSAAVRVTTPAASSSFSTTHPLLLFPHRELPRVCASARPLATPFSVSPAAAAAMSGSGGGPSSSSSFLHTATAIDVLSPLLNSIHLLDSIGAALIAHNATTGVHVLFEDEATAVDEGCLCDCCYSDDDSDKSRSSRTHEGDEGDARQKDSFPTASTAAVRVALQPSTQADVTDAGGQQQEEAGKRCYQLREGRSGTAKRQEEREEDTGDKKRVEEATNHRNRCRDKHLLYSFFVDETADSRKRVHCSKDQEGIQRSGGTGALTAPLLPFEFYRGDGGVGSGASGDEDDDDDCRAFINWPNNWELDPFLFEARRLREVLLLLRAMAECPCATMYLFLFPHQREWCSLFGKVVHFLKVLLTRQLSRMKPLAEGGQSEVAGAEDDAGDSRARTHVARDEVSPLFYRRNALPCPAMVYSETGTYVDPLLRATAAWRSQRGGVLADSAYNTAAAAAGGATGPVPQSRGLGRDGGGGNSYVTVPYDMPSPPFSPSLQERSRMRGSPMHESQRRGTRKLIQEEMNERKTCCNSEFSRTYKQRRRSLPYADLRNTAERSLLLCAIQTVAAMLGMKPHPQRQPRRETAPAATHVPETTCSGGVHARNVPHTAVSRRSTSHARSIACVHGGSQAVLNGAQRDAASLFNLSSTATPMNMTPLSASAFLSTAITATTIAATRPISPSAPGDEVTQTSELSIGRNAGGGGCLRCGGTSAIVPPLDAAELLHTHARASGTASAALCGTPTATSTSDCTTSPTITTGGSGVNHPIGNNTTGTVGNWPGAIAHTTYYRRHRDHHHRRTRSSNNSSGGNGNIPRRHRRDLRGWQSANHHTSDGGGADVGEVTSAYYPLSLPISMRIQHQREHRYHREEVQQQQNAHQLLQHRHHHHHRSMRALLLAERGGSGGLMYSDMEGRTAGRSANEEEGARAADDAAEEEEQEGDDYVTEMEGPTFTIRRQLRRQLAYEVSVGELDVFVHLICAEEAAAAARDGRNVLSSRGRRIVECVEFLVSHIKNS